MARADKATTKPDTADSLRNKTQPQPGAQGAGKEADALDSAGNVDEKKLKQNQKQLEVGADHKTDKMRKQHRGTFP
jgi:hypothetical protein